MAENHTNQKILEALHIDGRASWQRIAEAIGENERTVARRGSALIADGTVKIVAFMFRPMDLSCRSTADPARRE